MLFCLLKPKQIFIVFYVFKQEGIQIIDDFLRKVVELQSGEVTEEQLDSKIEELKKELKGNDNLYVKELLVK